MFVHPVFTRFTHAHTTGCGFSPKRPQNTGLNFDVFTRKRLDEFFVNFKDFT